MVEEWSAKRKLVKDDAPTRLEEVVLKACVIPTAATERATTSSSGDLI